ncbi:MAG: DUF255 domain-containing protein [Planctomycetota bacterium]
MPKHTNSLAGSTSPYLLQHASNPVAWYPWGDEAFAAARDRDVPIFLSIGYSTCYWCHVMERESFESEAIASVMNDRFVCIKLDREERPDVDDLYMTATQAMTGRGGWPMSVFLEPASLKPYYCGTYFPPTPRQGMPSFEQVLVGMSEAWVNRRADVGSQAARLAEAVEEQLVARDQPVVIGTEHVQQAVGTLLKIADMQHGGFAHAPKFPQPAYIDFLLDVRDASDEPTRQAIDAVVRLTLDQMLIGGIHDHVGGGFHRYSVDAHWTVPHFEKMLYDNGQLAATYARAAAIYGVEDYRRVATRTCDFVLREMTDDAGGFLSAQDAEVNSREGLNYLWTAEQVCGALPPDEAEFAVEVFGLDAGANFRDPHHPDDPPSSVLRLSELPRERAGRLDRVCATLLRRRATREPPGTDDKVLAAWNGIMIRGLADTAALTGETRYLDAAERSAAFLRTSMLNADGELLRSFRDGRAHTPAFLDDYANVIVGLVALARAQEQLGRDSGPTLDLAERLAEQSCRLFVDRESNAMFDTRADANDLFVRGRSTYDGALPSAVATMLNAWLDLSGLRPNREIQEMAVRSLVAHSAAIHDSPIATIHSTRALFRMVRDGVPLADAFDRVGAEVRESIETQSIQPVEIYTDTDRVAVREETPAELSLRVRVAPGYHIIAADPGASGEGLIPLRVAIVGGAGVNVYADYPEGTAMQLPGLEGGALVHEGELDLTLALEAVGAPSGRHLLVVTFQACSETECLPPQTLELDVAIDTS